MRIFVKPGDGRHVPMPSGKPVPAEGMMVELDSFVRRRLRDGDLVRDETAEAALAVARQRLLAAEQAADAATAAAATKAAAAADAAARTADANAAKANAAAAAPVTGG